MKIFNIKFGSERKNWYIMRVERVDNINNLNNLVMKKYIILVNDGVLNEDGKNIFSREELNVIFENWNGGKVMMDWNKEKYSIDDLIEYGSIGEKVEIYYDENMVEMGDEFVSLSVVEVSS